MKGRLEHQIVVEKKLQDKLSTYPKYMLKYYYSLHDKTHMTKKSYLNAALKFVDYLQENNIKIEEIDGFVINQYFNDIKYYIKDGEQKELTNTTRAAIYSYLNSFCIFLTRSRIIEANPFTNNEVAYPKPEETEITYLTPEEVKMVEDQILYSNEQSLARSKQEDWKYRDYLIFRIPVVTGLRVTALDEINIRDIDFQKNIIKVTEKGNKNRSIYIDDKTKEYLLLWIRERHLLMNGYNDDDSLFISNRRTRMSVRSMEKIIEKYTTNVVRKHITPHKLRSTCGTNLYQSEKDIYLVANVLGHKTTAPTQRYAKIFDQSVKDAVKTVASMYE